MNVSTAMILWKFATAVNFEKVWAHQVAFAVDLDARWGCARDLELAILIINTIQAAFLTIRLF